jgi:hypothetical protein
MHSVQPSPAFDPDPSPERNVCARASDEYGVPGVESATREALQEHRLNDPVGAEQDDVRALAEEA